MVFASWSRRDTAVSLNHTQKNSQNNGNDLLIFGYTLYIQYTILHVNLLFIYIKITQSLVLQPLALYNTLLQLMLLTI